MPGTARRPLSTTLRVVLAGAGLLAVSQSGAHASTSQIKAFYAMWDTVIAKYAANANAYFEVTNEPYAYSATDLDNFYNDWLTRYPASYVEIRNAATNLEFDGMGRTANGADLGQYSDSSSTNQRWKIVAGS